tara:strand:+ start:3702 stop:6380 length:2679 start_codon:yes stop_codon:yes gene_type:complete
LINKKKEIFVIIDGSSYLYRAFYALPHLKNNNGSHTGAIFGVTNMINKLLNDFSPKYVCAVFDARGKNFRHRIYKEYKSNRKSMPTELSEQVEPIFDFLKYMGIKIIQHPDVEADDVIASLVNKHSTNIQTFISSGDKDLAQLVNKNVSLMNSLDGKQLDQDGVKKKFGVAPNQIKDYLTLVGDSSDNIPGVPKIGPKTAVNLLDKYLDLNSILENIDELKTNLRENLQNSLTTIKLAQELISLKSDIDLRSKIDDYLVSTPNEKKLSTFINTYNLNKLSKDLGIKKIEKTNTKESKYSIVNEISELDKLMKACSDKKIFAFDTETDSTDSIKASLVGVSICLDINTAFYIPINHHKTDTQVDLKTLILKLQNLFINKNITVIGQNIKYDMNVLYKYGITMECKIQDTMIMSYIIDSSGKHDLDSLAEKHLNIQTIKYEELVGKGRKQLTLSDLSAVDVYKYACEDADIAMRLYHYFNNKLENLNEQSMLYKKIELPLIKILSRMELAGVKVDNKKLSKLSKYFGEKIKELENSIYKIVGRNFNISSPKQLQEIFYEEMNLPVLKKTPKGQPSTSEDVMIDLAEHHEVPKLVLEYRNLSKLKNTYTDKLGETINESTRRLHTSYNQTVTITGRLSSSNPNLQNIPIKTKNGRDIRKTFIPEEGSTIISADYSQIELRVMAHLSQDKTLLKSFKNNEDIHSVTAKEIFSIPGQPSDQQRRVAKTINFGLIYGISSFGLAKQLRIDNSEAKEFIDKYFLKYSGVKEFMSEIKKEAKAQGYVKTLAGRRIFLPNITHSNFQIRSAAERTAINAPIQGTAADILKLAMIEIDKWLINENDNIKMLMQVHDELVFEVKESFVTEAKSKINNLMCNCSKLDVPLVVDIGIGDNWETAH